MFYLLSTSNLRSGFVLLPLSSSSPSVSSRGLRCSITTCRSATTARHSLPPRTTLNLTPPRSTTSSRQQPPPAPPRKFPQVIRRTIPAARNPILLSDSPLPGWFFFLQLPRQRICPRVWTRVEKSVLQWWIMFAVSLDQEQAAVWGGGSNVTVLFPHQWWHLPHLTFSPQDYGKNLPASSCKSLTQSITSLRDYLCRRTAIFITLSSRKASDATVNHLMQVEDGWKANATCMASKGLTSTFWLTLKHYADDSGRWMDSQMKGGNKWAGGIRHKAGSVRHR